jgi:hypothetical protein
MFNTNPDVGALSVHPLSGKKLAFDLEQVPEEYFQKANGHKFNITGIRDSAEQICRDLFENNTIVDDPSEADVVLALNLDLSLTGAFLGTSCSSTANWEIKKANGEILADGQATSTSKIPTMPAGGGNCEITFLKAMPEALDNALNKLR